ncbi:MAG: hypothetical protein H6R15_1343 [Proteobacteria bacterium]|nr:hypothetical protein [Pseudomonadota bacterium]
MLQRGPHAAARQAGNVAVGDFADQQRIGGDGAGPDVGQLVVDDGPLRAQVDDRAEIEIYAEPCQTGALFLAIAAGPLVQAATLPFEQAGQRRQVGQHRRQMGDAAAFLVSGDDQRWQTGLLTQLLQAGDFSGDLAGRTVAHIAPGQVDAADQAAFGQGLDFGKTFEADDEMAAQQTHVDVGGKNFGARCHELQLADQGQAGDGEQGDREQPVAGTFPATPQPAATAQAEAEQ